MEDQSIELQTKDSLRKAQNRKKSAAYRLRNKEQKLARRRELRQQNLEERRRKDRELEAKHPEKKKVKNKTQYKKRRESILAKKKLERIEHPAKARLADKKHRTKNKDKILILNSGYRARKKNAPVNNFRHSEWVAILKMHDYRCAYCGKRAKGKLTQDHIIPLAKGGAHTASNIVPACRSCNSKKSVGPPLQPIQQFLLLPA